MVGGVYTMEFNSSLAINAYLPAGGRPNALTESSVNPTSSDSGVFGGQVLALRLNLDFNDEGLLGSFLDDFGSVVFSDTSSFFDGWSISEVLSTAETALGGGWIDIAALNNLATFINEAFDNCEPSDWAQTHLTPSQD